MLLKKIFSGYNTYVLNTNVHTTDSNLNYEGVRVMAFNATYFGYRYIVAVSFIGGGNWCTLRKQPTCHNSLTNFIT